MTSTEALVRLAELWGSARPEVTAELCRRSQRARLMLDRQLRSAYRDDPVRTAEIAALWADVG